MSHQKMLSCRRLGRIIPGKVQPLLVTVRSADDYDDDEGVLIGWYVYVHQMYESSRNHQTNKPAAAAAAAVYGRLPAASTNDRRAKYPGLSLYHFTCYAKGLIVSESSLSCWCNVRSKHMSQIQHPAREHWFINTLCWFRASN